MILFRLDDVLKEKGRSAYWLSQQTGILQNRLSVMRRKSKGIQWDTLEKICKALECSPGDLIALVDEKAESKKKTKSKG